MYPAIYRHNSKDSFDGASASTFTSISTTATATATRFFYGRRNIDEGSTTPMIIECYELSEVSIEWRMTTVEGHNDIVVEEKWKRKGGNNLFGELLVLGHLRGCFREEFFELA
ncbi:hypothetical protein JHK82_055119 [Glycine max]|nr:hypothetical protein JHK86_054961 [Glycine max]KAG4917652.1 hypothetical protein JHK85_055933 [Glycine max]KAG5076424.1 hypothetical protein JHK82_055119 [Glycine max]